MPEDRAKMHAFLAWRSEHCPSCSQRRADWLDKDGIQLRDPPFEVAEVLCPPCGMLADYQENEEKVERPKGTQPYFRRLDPDEEPVGD